MGFFLGQGPNKSYVGGKVSYFNHYEVDTWSIVWIDDFLCQMLYPKDLDRQVYWLFPSKALSNGLGIVSSDTEIVVMQSLVHEVKNFVLYIDHNNSISGLNWDDIAANLVATLPKVFSPQKVINAGRKEDEKLPDFYSDLKRASEEMDPDNGSETSGDEDDPDFVDSDYEVDAEGDDLFTDNVDEGVLMLDNYHF
jgi:hypothetical protein